MSRYSSSRVSSSRDDGWRRTKAALFWAFLLVASFVVGAVVVSPLLSLTSGSERQEDLPPIRRDPPARSAATAPPPQPEPAPSAPERQPYLAPSVRARPSREEPAVQPSQPVESDAGALETDTVPPPAVSPDRVDTSVERPRRARRQYGDDVGQSPRRRTGSIETENSSVGSSAAATTPDASEPPRRQRRRSDETRGGERASEAAPSPSVRAAPREGSRAEEPTRPSPARPRPAAPGAGGGSGAPVQPGESID